MSNRGFGHVCLLIYFPVLCITVMVSCASSDKGPAIIVLGAGSGASSFSSLGSGAPSSPAGGAGSMITSGGSGGSPNILVLGGEGSGKKGDKKSSVIIIMQPQPQQQTTSQQSQQQPSHYQQHHPYHIHHAMSMSHPLMHYPSHQDYYGSQAMQPQMLSRRGMFGASPGSMSEENLLKLMSLPAFHSNFKGSTNLPIGNGHKQWVGMSSEPYSTTVADSVASSSDLSDYLSHSYGYRK